MDRFQVFYENHQVEKFNSAGDAIQAAQKRPGLYLHSSISDLWFISKQNIDGTMGFTEIHSVPEELRLLSILHS